MVGCHQARERGWMSLADMEVVGSAPLPKNVGKLISEYVDREKVLYFLR